MDSQFPLPSRLCPAVPGTCPCPMSGHTWACGRAGLESPPAPGAGTACSQRFRENAEHTRPLGELTHRKHRGLMSKLVNFPDDRAEEAEAAHRSPWTPPAHECEPAAATGLSWEGHGPSGTPQPSPARRLLPAPSVHPVNTLVLYLDVYDCYSIKLRARGL